MNPSTGGNYAQKAGLQNLPAGEPQMAFPAVSFSGPNSPTYWAGYTYTYGWQETTNAYTLQDAAISDTTVGTTGRRYKTYSLYAQDDWRAQPRLVINAGLRYDIPKQAWYRGAQLSIVAQCISVEFCGRRLSRRFAVCPLLAVKQAYLLIRDGRVPDERCAHFFARQNTQEMDRGTISWH